MEIDNNGLQNLYGQELWSFGNNYTIFNDISETVGNSNQLVAVGTIGTNTAAPENMLSTFELGGSSLWRNRYWGTGPINRAFNVFSKKATGSGNSNLHHTFITGYTTDTRMSSTVDIPYILKLNKYIPPCVRYVEHEEEITTRDWTIVN